MLTFQKQVQSFIQKSLVTFLKGLVGFPDEQDCTDLAMLSDSSSSFTQPVSAILPC